MQILAEVWVKSALHLIIVMTSARGVSQGCPLSPYVFQLVMSAILEQPRVQYPLTISYLDDVNVATSSVAEATMALKVIEESAKQFDLILNHSKCALYWPKTDSDSQVDQENWDQQTEFKKSREGMEILGSCIGEKRYMTEFSKRAFMATENKVDSFNKLMQQWKFQHPDEQLVQKGLVFIRYCLCAQNNHLIRTMHPSVTKEHAEHFDQSIVGAWIALAPRESEEVKWTSQLENLKRSYVYNPCDVIKDDLYSLAHHRIFMQGGGLGLRSAGDNREAAYLGSIALSASTIREAMNLIDAQEEAMTILGAVEMEQTVQEQAEEMKEKVENILPVFNPEKDRKKLQQKICSED